jgi:hypothetical protein
MTPFCSETRISQLSGRSDVLETPPEIMAKNGMLISGHHGLKIFRTIPNFLPLFAFHLHPLPSTRPPKEMCEP